MNPLPGSFHHKDIQGCIIIIFFSCIFIVFQISRHKSLKGFYLLIYLFLISPHSAWSPSLYSISNQCDRSHFFPPPQPRPTQTWQAERKSQQALEWNSVSQPKLNTLLCYCNSRQASGCSGALFPPFLSFTSTVDDVRSPGLESVTAASRSCEWGGRQSRARTHTRHKLRVSCSDFAPIRSLGFRLHLNKGIQLHTPHLLIHKSTLCSGIKSAHSGYLCQLN